MDGGLVKKFHSLNLFYRTGGGRLAGLYYDLVAVVTRVRIPPSALKSISMKYRLLLVFAVLAAASPIAADTFESEESSLENLTYSNSVLLASSGGETVLSSTLSERGGIYAADRENGTQAQLEEGHIQDVEWINSTHLAYVSSNLTSNGIDSVFRVENRETGETVRESNISRNVNDIERVGPEYRFANSSGIYTVADQKEAFTSLNIDEEAEVTDLEFFKNATVLATQDPDQIIIREENSSRSFNISQPEDLQVIGLEPVTVLVAHDSRVVEYKESGEGLEDVWSYSGLDDGRAVNRLSDNTTIIAERNSVFAVNSSGDEVWETEFFSASDIESPDREVYSFEGVESGTDIDSYWSPSNQRTDKAQLGFIEGLLQAGFNTIFG